MLHISSLLSTEYNWGPPRDRSPHHGKIGDLEGPVNGLTNRNKENAVGDLEGPVNGLTNRNKENASLWIELTFTGQDTASVPNGRW